ncbi:hypothetical protein NA57DRAFT_77381 [Rhizodiscina lignyota]|uniref:Mso1 N-terminal domain-containing protein n=1 Tax=Rhizodiscina lignyota TaxID=1504668 RepID=A0A9P4IF86_9PEZI|nr:hypothetical protein NA57DRAFT_77381 [Rhizodiscina lignyota]
MSSYSSYLSSALTTATNKYTSLRRALLPDETDGDTDDDSHVCRVLRAYYTEKGRQLPEWLPPDPKAPPPPPAAQFVSSTRRQQEGGYGGSGQMGGQRGSGGGLSDLWDNSGRSSTPAAVPSSLRAGRANNMSMDSAQSSTTSLSRSSARPGIVDSYQRGGGEQAQAQSRPLPSQRAGSYQSGMKSPPSDQTPPGSSGGGSAQDRLKARLWGGGRSSSPVANQSAASSPGLSSVGSRNPYEPSGGSGGRDQQPMTSANAPWAGGGDDYGVYSGGGGYGSSGNPYASSTNQAPSRSGLPSGPKRGLPGGPRPHR